MWRDASGQRATRVAHTHARFSFTDNRLQTTAENILCKDFAKCLQRFAEIFAKNQKPATKPITTLYTISLASLYTISVNTLYTIRPFTTNYAKDTRRSSKASH